MIYNFSHPHICGKTLKDIIVAYIMKKNLQYRLRCFACLYARAVKKAVLTA
jgi:hypothetical protein